MCLHTDSYLKVYNSFICNHKMLETIQKSISQWMDTFTQWNDSNKNTWNTDTCNNMGGCQKHYSTQWKYKRLYNHDPIYMTFW